MDNETLRPEIPRLITTINNKRPVELGDLVVSLQGMASEYRDFVMSQGGVMAPDDVKLYVHELRTSSIITELAPVVAASLPIIEHTNQVAATVKIFAVHLRAAYYFVLGKEHDGETPEPEQLTKQTLQNLSSIVEPVAKDNGSQINIAAGVTLNNATFNAPVLLGLSSMEASAFQNEAARRIKAMQSRVAGIHTKVAMRLLQVRDNLSNSVGDRGIIESISTAHIKLDMDESIKAMVMAGDPFKYFYIVDVEVETVDNSPVLYKVLRLHEKELRPGMIE